MGLAGYGTPVIPGMMKTLGYHQYTDLTTAKDLTDGGAFTVPAGTHFLLIVVEGNAVRWLDTGSTPSATVGMPLAVGDYLLTDVDLANFRWIQQAGGAKGNITFKGV